MAKPKKWNEMSPAEQAAENEARGAAKAAKRAADKAALEAEVRGEKPMAPPEKMTSAGSPAPGPAEAPKPQSGNLAKAAKKAKAPVISEGLKARTEYVQNIERNLARGTPEPSIPGQRATAAPEIHLPNRPLPGQGSMADKPVEKVVQKVSPNILTPEGTAKWNAAKDADRRITQGAGPQAERRAALQAQKVMTPAGAVESTAPKAPADPFAAMRESTKRGFGAVKTHVDDSVKEAYKASTQLGRRAGKSFAERAGMATAKGAKWAASTTGKALIGTAKSVTEPVWKPFAEFAAGHGERKAAHAAADAAVSGAKGLKAQAAARAAKGWAVARTGGAAALTGGKLALGGIKAGTEGLAAAVLWETGKQAALAETGSRAAMGRHVRSGAKQGLTVTHAEPSFTRMALGGSPKIKVHDPSQDAGPDGKSLSQKRRERGEAKFQYDKLKKAAGRNVITGSSE